MLQSRGLGRSRIDNPSRNWILGLRCLLHFDVFRSHPIQSARGHWVRVSLRSGASKLGAKHPPLGLNQEFRAFVGFDREALSFAATAFTRPVSATTCGAAVIGSHPGSP